MKPEDIVKVRGRLGLTRDEFATAAGATPSEVMKWEAGEGTPSIEQLLRIRRALSRNTNVRQSPPSGRRSPRSSVMPGWKVQISGREDLGFGRAEDYSTADGTVNVIYDRGPAVEERLNVEESRLLRPPLPLQTRCYLSEGEVIRIGRVILSHDMPDGSRCYDIQLPNKELRAKVPEASFRVQSYHGDADPVSTLKALAHETPFFHSHRDAWVKEYGRHAALSGGVVGYVSGKVELFPHQLEVVQRVLSDPIMRYLLADEVGLGKTVEAAAIISQLRHDNQHTRVTVFAPDILVPQWQGELSDRFGLAGIDVRSHSSLDGTDTTGLDAVIIDEAHQLVAQRDFARPGSVYDRVLQMEASRRHKHLLLLSATPSIHNAEQLLALLCLLDPDAYGLSQVEDFKKRLDARRQLGRSLLALGHARQPVFIDRQLRAIADQLSKDPIVVSLIDALDQISDPVSKESALRAAVTRVRIHVTETYRIHRRLLRTRRKTLLEEGDIRQLRVLGTPDYLADVSSQARNDVDGLWEALEAWRIATCAATPTDDPQAIARLARRYVEIAMCCAAQGTILVPTLKTLLSAVDIAGEQYRQALMAAAERVSSGTYRQEQAMRLAGRLTSGKWVWFCDTKDALGDVRSALNRAIQVARFVVARDQSVAENHAALKAFRDSPGEAWLLTDDSLDVGANLEMARGMVLWNLPFDPMTIEQRVGRLDRLNRTRDLEIACALTSHDEGVAFDAAWFGVLTRGLGLQTSSLADLQFFVERELSTLAVAAVMGGPARLVEESERLAGAIQAERETSAEQDVIDGLFVGRGRETSAWKELDDAEAKEAQLENAMRGYIDSNVGLSVRPVSMADGQARRRVCAIGQKGNALPLIPIALLAPLTTIVGRPATTARLTATRDLGLEFLRPGHEAMDALWRLAQWDERGRAFAMWRRAPGFAEMQLVFRVNIRVAAESGALEAAEYKHDLDDVAASALMRRIRRWVPTTQHEVFVDQDGKEASSAVVRLCAPRYDKTYDVHLGGERTHVLLDIIGQKAWSRCCEVAALRASQLVRDSAAVRSRFDDAARQAKEYFALLETRAELRLKRGIDSAPLSARENRHREHFRSLVDSILSNPIARLDSMGAYFLSDSRPLFEA